MKLNLEQPPKNGGKRRNVKKKSKIIAKQCPISPKFAKIRPNLLEFAQNRPNLLEFAQNRRNSPKFAKNDLGEFFQQKFAKHLQNSPKSSKMAKKSPIWQPCTYFVPVDLPAPDEYRSFKERTNTGNQAGLISHNQPKS